MFETTFDYFFWLYLVPAGLTTCYYTTGFVEMKQKYLETVRLRDGHSFNEKLTSRDLTGWTILFCLVPLVNLLSAVVAMTGVLAYSAVCTFAFVRTYLADRRR